MDVCQRRRAGGNSQWIVYHGVRALPIRHGEAYIPINALWGFTDDRAVDA